MQVINYILKIVSGGDQLDCAFCISRVRFAFQSLEFILDRNPARQNSQSGDDRLAFTELLDVLV